MQASETNLVLTILLCLLLTQELKICKGQELPTETGQIDCPAECNRRCSLASRHKMCIRACNTCCHRCGCVPPGTSGHYETCPCYANMTTHHGRKKCP